MKPAFLTAILLLLIAVALNVVQLLSQMGNIMHPWRLTSPEELISFVALSGVILIALFFHKNVTANQRVALGSFALAMLLLIIGNGGSLKYPANLILMVMGSLVLLAGVTTTLRNTKKRRHAGSG